MEILSNESLEANIFRWNKEELEWDYRMWKYQNSLKTLNKTKIHIRSGQSLFLKSNKSEASVIY